MNKQEFAEYLNGLFKKHSFKKRCLRWSLERENIIKIIKLRKSIYGNNYYIDYGYILKNLDIDGLDMHISYGLSSVDDKENLLIQNLLNFDNDITDEDRKKELEKYLVSEIINKFEHVFNENDIYSELKKRKNLNDIPLIVKKHFNLPTD